MQNKILKAAQLIMLIFGQFVCYCQNKTSKINIELLAGVAIPVGKFSDKTYTNSPTESKPSGLAKPGFAGSISALYAMQKQYGVLITTGMSFHNQDPESYRTWVRSTGSSSNKVDVKTEAWQIFKLMGGGWLSTAPKGNSKIAFRFDIALGICKTAVPGYSYTEYDQNMSFKSSTTQSKQSLPVSFCYQAGMNFNYRIRNRLSISVATSFFNANAKQHYQYYPNFPNTNTLISAERKYNLASLNLQTGINVFL